MPKASFTLAATGNGDEWELRLPGQTASYLFEASPREIAAVSDTLEKTRPEKRARAAVETLLTFGDTK